MTGKLTRQARRTAHLAAMQHVLAASAASPGAEHLVLRGSVPLRTWLGAAAREPHDLDFVVTPSTLDPDGDPGRRLVDGLVEAVRAHPPTGGVQVDRVTVEELDGYAYGYGDASGRRLTVACRLDGDRAGTVQVDVVFNEELAAAPTTVRVALAATQPPVTVRAATPELSVAWKLLWMRAETYPELKDLYDAVLLAEHAAVDWPLLRRVLAAELGSAAADGFRPGTVLEWDFVDSDDAPFIDEIDDVAAWQQRLADALAATAG